MTLTTKQREILTEYGEGRISGSDRGNPIKTQVGQREVIKGYEITRSEGHPFASRTRGIAQDIGGDFYNEKHYLQPIKGSGGMSVNRNVSGIQRSRTYTGPVLPFKPSFVSFPSSLKTSDDDLGELGATAIARCKPTNSVADAATFLGELYKDRIPDLPGSATWQSRNLTARNAGEDFLNVEFGWLPLVNDVKKFTKAVKTANAVLAQYERDAGKVVRRRYNFPEQVSVKHNDFGTGNPAWLGGVDDSTFYDGTQSGVVQTVETVKRQWFSGAFTYALPSGYDSRNALDRFALMADKVYGASLTPDTLWELSPWSWAVDWFSNTGDVISNISSWSADGLVMAYGYMMEHTIHRHTYRMANSGYAGNPPVSPLVYVTETKTRKRANPFGFGVSWDGLSPIQTAIAAAIGLTR